MAGSIVIAWAMAGLSIVVMRLGWGTRRSVALAGWGLAAMSLALLARHAGAWGIATGCTIGMIVAMAIVLHAGWLSPAKPRRALRQPVAVAMPQTYRDLGRRISIFFLVVPLAFAAAQWLAYAVQAAVRNGTPLDANSLALTLFLQPAIWTLLMSWQMTLSSPVRMILPPAFVAMLGAILWSMS